MIIDTDVIIYELRGHEKAGETIRRSVPFDMSVVTYIELVQGMRNKKELDNFLRQLSLWDVKIIQVSEDISTRAMLYVEDFFLSHSMSLADALIAATCVGMSKELLTANDKHYKHISNLQIRKFRP